VKTALIAIGGNSLIRAGETGHVHEQRANARRTSRAIAQVIADGYSIVVTHGNGPQVGAALLRSERASDQVYSQPLDVCVAETQGEIGYILEQALSEAIAAAGLRTPVVTIVAQVIVSAGDHAFTEPTKPIGPFMSRRDAEGARDRLGWHIVNDAARGWRRVVPSPEPLAVVEEDVIADLFRRQVVVITAGGGGIPVVRHDGALRGIEAVIDKDAVSALLASRLDVDSLVISTDVERVYLDYRQPEQRPLERVTAAQLRSHYAAGHFPSGNMGPNILAALRFLGRGGTEAIITSDAHLASAMRGAAGTHIVAKS
jgi:carbamate kinase